MRVSSGFNGPEHFQVTYEDNQGILRSCSGRGSPFCVSEKREQRDLCHRGVMKEHLDTQKYRFLCWQQEMLLAFPIGLPAMCFVTHVKLMVIMWRERHTEIICL